MTTLGIGHVLAARAESIIYAEEATMSNNVIDISEIDRSVYLALPRRRFDPSKGDARFRDGGKAFRHAENKATETGRRQVVRLDQDALGDRLFLVQEFGS